MLQNLGFAFLILVALACSTFMAATTHTPEPVPDFALRAPEIYRLEIGAAFFLAFYLVTLTFLLALSGRGFAEFGSKGLKVDQVVWNEATLLQQVEIDRRAAEAPGDRLTSYGRQNIAGRNGFLLAGSADDHRGTVCPAGPGD